ncbi:DUF4097 family beta strand repeat-containing protein [Roseivirga sp. E12]|uniref:DUF4097 family beta strand repeat-containing protein n=1 Tax=Roseivirga sp. E12 TaxID=2819237 RepID=UPI001ABCF018|nr:DUF4097 family beta strand repeat-containing protein [Roseivirga sp. E12]MBO3700360.1 DUF4097 family beta strand repeat protein [Roseivirga sp. E12]
MKAKILFTCASLLTLFIGNITAQDKNFNLDEVYNLASDGTIHLKSEDANVKITGSDRSDVHVVIDRTETTRGVRSSRSRFDIKVEERQGDLYITESARRGVTFQIGSWRVDYEIEIEMPQTGSLRIKGDDDDYVIRSVNGEISIETDDGDIELIECNGNKFDLQLEDGDLRMDGGKGSLYVNVDDGDIDLRNGNFDTIEVSAEDGNVSLETSLSDNGVYEIRGDDADIDFVVLSGGGEFNVSKDDGRISATSAFDKIQETERRAKLELDGGKADVDIRIEDGRVRLSTGK